ncbi:hypothetical protein HYY71_06755 [Candidatus Woesearchaeota archaeon]|nr:hypothetical protein [Candidatus Woesearchaeota archaeon]
MMQQLNAKESWFNKKLRSGFFIFDKNEFPKFTNTSYDPLLFGIINSAYIRKNMLDAFFRALEPFIVFDEKKSDYRIDSSKSEEIKKLFLKDRILSGLTVFELGSKGSIHLDLLQELGAIVPDNTKNSRIPIQGENSIKLKNWSDYIKEKYDITFSNELMDERSGIKYEKHSDVFSGFEMFSVYANITKKDGFSLHANGSVISSLYETYFQFIGFKVIDYFRNADDKHAFTIIMKKFNEKQTSYDEFFYIYTELKKRWPTRYGN